MGGSTQTEVSNKVVAAGAQEIIERAARRGVSDIHIEPGPRLVLVRYRHGGVLYVANKLPLAASEPLTQYFKLLAGLDIGQTTAPQSGNGEFKLGRRTYNLEVATLPVLNGEKITIKLHEAAASILSLEELGLWGVALASVKRLLGEPHGLILMAGHQVGYLNVSLSAFVHALDSPLLKKAFINTENLPLPQSIRQLSVNPAVGLDTAVQLNIVSREQPNVLAVSVLAEPAAVQAAMQAAKQSLVLAGLLADTAVAGLLLLQRMEPDTALMPVAIGQLFVRSLCTHCREAYEPSIAEHGQLAELFNINRSAVMQRLHELEQTATADGLGSDQPLGSTPSRVRALWRARPHGCQYCDHTGYDNEIGVFEVLEPGSAVQKAFVERQPLDFLRKAAIKNGMLSLEVDGFIKALRGLIDVPTLLGICALTR